MRYFLVSLFLLITIQTSAQDKIAMFQSKWLLEGGIEYGGDELVELTFEDGDTQTMLAGQGGYVAFGGEFALSSLPRFVLRTSIGIKYNTNASSNADINLTRWPLTIMPILNINDSFRLGVGLTKHLRVFLDGDGFLPDLSMTSSVGPRFELGYKWFAITYTHLSYKWGGVQTYSASSFGANVTYTF
jgi:hypothetical protein